MTLFNISPSGLLIPADLEPVPDPLADFDALFDGAVILMGPTTTTLQCPDCGHCSTYRDEPIPSACPVCSGTIDGECVDLDRKRLK